MRKLTLLIVAVVVAWWGAATFARAAPPPSYMLRDGLIVLAAAALIFGANAGALLPCPIQGLQRRWSWVALVLSVAGVALAGAATAAYAFAIGSAATAPALWLLGIALLAIGVWWGGAPQQYAAPAYHWSLDAAGRFVRLALGNEPSALAGEDRAGNLAAAVRGLRWPFLIVVAAGLFLRGWGLSTLPADCIGAECSRALQLVENATPVHSLYDLLARGIVALTGDGLFSLRLAGALLGMATLPAFYWAVRPFDRAGGAALATLLLALSPWHIWASRTSDPWIALPLLICLALGSGVRAAAQLDRRWWWAAGAAFGLLLLESAAFRLPGALWLTAALALGLWALAPRLDWPGRLLHGAVLVAGAAVILAPGWAAGWGVLPATEGQALHSGGAALLTALVQGGGAAVNVFVENPLLSGLIVALAAVGIGSLGRSIMRPRAALAGVGLVAYAVALAVIAPAGEPAGPALLLLPFLLLAAGLALDDLILAFYRAWHALVPAAWAISVALALVVIAGGWRTVDLLRDLAAGSVAVEGSVETAMGRYLADCLRLRSEAACIDGVQEGAPGTFTPVIYAPRAALEHPATRLILGGAAETGRVRPLDPTRDLPAGGPIDSDLIYLAGMDNMALVDLLQQIYPESQVTALPLDGPTQFVAVHVPQAVITARQGLEGTYFEGDHYGAPEAAKLTLRAGPLTFAWAQEPPLPPPFSVLWEGSLLVPQAGAYGLSVDLPPDATGATLFTLQLDGRVVLDNSLGLLEKQEALAQGAVHLTMRYRGSAPPPDWSVRWQPPGGEFTPIPREALVSPALPDMGLLGAYFAGDQFTGPALTIRKDLAFGQDVDLPMPYSVQWAGKLAAPRTGEYRLAATGDGLVQMRVDGEDLIIYLPNPDDANAPVYGQASVYLTQGWHPFEIRYAPSGPRPNLRLLWQPPGSGPELLPPAALRPTTAELAVADAPLPPAPPLLDPRLGDDRFALSYTMDTYVPDVVSPPAHLPPLLLEQAWQVGTCGAGENQLNSPHGVAVDMADGRVFVADTGNRRVVVYALQDGAQLATITSDLFQEPADLAIGADGNVWLVDAQSEQVLRIDPAEGVVTPLASNTTFYRPRGLGLDPAGNLYVADTGGGRVAMLSPTGDLLVQYGGPETLFGLGQPVDVLANGSVWSVTAEDGRLWRLDDLASIAAIPRANTLDGPHLAGLPDGSLFLTNPIGAAVQYHAAGGEPLGQLAYPGAFINPVGVGAGQAGDTLYLAVADSAACTVSVWRGPVSALGR